MKDECRHWTTPRWLSCIYDRMLQPFVVTIDGSLPIAGSVDVNNFPETQPVSGSVGVTSLPSIPSGSNAIGSITNTTFISETQTLSTFTNTITGAISGNTIFLGPIDCGNFRQVSFQCPLMGTGMQFIAEFSNNGTNYFTAAYYSAASAALINGSFSNGSYSGNSFTSPTYGFKFWRLRVSTGASAGTTTAVAYFSQIPASVPTSSVVTATASPNTGSAPQTPSSYISVAGTNALVISANSSNFFALFITNTTAAMKYVKVYNRNTLPTIGTDVPTWTIGIPPMATIDISNSFAGARFLSGISIGITGGYAVTDTTAVAAGDVIVNWLR